MFDNNQLPDNVFYDQGLDLYVHAPTHKGHCLDKIFASQPIYTNVKTVTSCIKTEHLAILARGDDIAIIDANKTRRSVTVRKPSPSRNSSFLSSTRMYDWTPVLGSTDPQLAADTFYSFALCLLDTFYPETSVTITSRDPSCTTPSIKKLLQMKNSFMRRGLTDRADALARRIGALITKSRAGRLSSINNARSSGDLWAAVREIAG